MAQFFSVHPTHPEKRLIRQAAQIVRQGGLIAYPTDSCYALGCHIGDTEALDRLMVDNIQYRLLKTATPGSYTFILRATRELPRRLRHPRRKAIGVRVPAHAVAHALLVELNEPMLSATFALPGDPSPLSIAKEIRERLAGAARPCRRASCRRDRRALASRRCRAALI